MCTRQHLVQTLLQHRLLLLANVPLLLITHGLGYYWAGTCSKCSTLSSATVQCPVAKQKKLSVSGTHSFKLYEIVVVKCHMCVNITLLPRALHVHTRHESQAYSSCTSGHAVVSFDCM